MGGTVLCGRTTFESFPGGALKGRRNVVLSRDERFRPQDAEVVRSAEEALRAVAGDDPERVWLIGGERVYRELLSACAKALVTYHEVSVPCDAFFPNLDEDATWRFAATNGTGTTDAGVAYEFREYWRAER